MSGSYTAEWSKEMSDKLKKLAHEKGMEWWDVSRGPGTSNVYAEGFEAGYMEATRRANQPAPGEQGYPTEDRLDAWVNVIKHHANQQSKIFARLEALEAQDTSYGYIQEYAPRPQDEPGEAEGDKG